MWCSQDKSYLLLVHVFFHWVLYKSLSSVSFNFNDLRLKYMGWLLFFSCILGLFALVCSYIWLWTFLEIMKLLFWILSRNFNDNRVLFFNVIVSSTLLIKSLTEFMLILTWVDKLILYWCLLWYIYLNILTTLPTVNWKWIILMRLFVA